MSEQAFANALVCRLPKQPEQVFRKVKYFMLTSTTEVSLEQALCNASKLLGFQTAWACEELAPTSQRRHMHLVVMLAQPTDLAGRVLKTITKHHPHLTRLSREVDFKRAVKYTLKPNTAVFAEAHCSVEQGRYFHKVMNAFYRHRAERVQAFSVRRQVQNLYALDYLRWCRVIGRLQDFPEVLRLTLLQD